MCSPHSALRADDAPIETPDTALADSLDVQEQDVLEFVVYVKTVAAHISANDILTLPSANSVADDV